MGLFQGLMGNASEVSIDDIIEEFAPMFIEDEEVEKAFKVIRDMFIFTNKRLLLIDKQGLTGSKTEYLSIPYKNIRLFSTESAGFLDEDAELKIWVAGLSTPIEKSFGSNSSIQEVYQILSKYVL